MAALEMRDLNRGETEDPAAVRETPFDLPDIPLDHQTNDQLSTELKIEQFINDSRKSLNLIKGLEKNVYKGMTVDKNGYLYYKQKRISVYGDKKLASIKTLLKNLDTREFLQKIGYESSSAVQPIYE